MWENWFYKLNTRSFLFLFLFVLVWLKQRNFLPTFAVGGNIVWGCASSTHVSAPQALSTYRRATHSNALHSFQDRRREATRTGRLPRRTEHEGMSPQYLQAGQLDQWSDHRPLCDGWVKPSLGHNAGDLLTNHVEGLSDQICLPVRKQSIALWFLEDPNICSKSPHQIHVMGDRLLLCMGKQSNQWSSSTPSIF